MTLWVFSTENLKRSQAEVSGILSAIEAKVAALAHDPFLHQRRIHIQAIGSLDLLPESVVAAIRAAERATTQYNLMTLTIAVGYGGREEIADAVRGFVKLQAQQGASLSDAIERITPEAIACYLYAANLPDPDLIIRTSGEIRLSGFLLWQSVHSEFYFTDVLWPALRKVDFLRAIRAYQACNSPLWPLTTTRTAVQRLASREGPRRPGNGQRSGGLRRISHRMHSMTANMSAVGCDPDEMCAGRVLLSLILSNSRHCENVEQTLPIISSILIHKRQVFRQACVCSVQIFIHQLNHGTCRCSIPSLLRL